MGGRAAHCQGLKVGRHDLHARRKPAGEKRLLVLFGDLFNEQTGSTTFLFPCFQLAIKRSLVDSGCPDHIVEELMSNAHERRWPPGLLTLETRQMNRRQYEQYVCRRIPNKQAVVVMACDNMHMSDDMILEPGLVMIFAHGIE